MNKNIIISIVAVILILLGIWAVIDQAQASVSLVTICHKLTQPHQTQQVAPQAVLAHLAHGDSLGACPTPSPSPSVSPSPSPSPTPTATPEPSEEPTPTPTPSDEPTPTPEPTVNPEPSSESTGDESSTQDTDCANLEALTEEQALGDCGESKLKADLVSEKATINTNSQPDLSGEFTQFSSTGFSWF